MSNPVLTIPDFRRLAGTLVPPPGKVRGAMSPLRMVGEAFGPAATGALGVGLAYVALISLPVPLNLLGSLAAVLTLGLWAYLGARVKHRWVELDGDVLRAKKLFSGRTVERPVGEISAIGIDVRGVYTGRPEGLSDSLDGVRGIEIRFHGGHVPLRVLRGILQNAEAIMAAVLGRLRRAGELELRAVVLRGQDVSLDLYLLDEPPPASNSTRLWRPFLGMSMSVPLMFGLLCGWVGAELRSRRDIGLAPPHEITVRELIDRGPGPNRHVILTGFRAGHAVASGNAEAFVGLFPADQPETRIQVVLESKAVPDGEAFQRLVETGRVAGHCSASPRGWWGMIGPDLVTANPGSEMTVAWSVEDVRELPTEAEIRGQFGWAVACFGAVILMGLVVAALAAWY